MRHSAALGTGALALTLVHALLLAPAGAQAESSTVVESSTYRGASGGREPLFSEPAPLDLLRGFDPPAHTWLAGHRGVDLRSEIGAPIRAAGAGVVAFAGIVVDRPTVSIDHPIGIRTTYEPVTSALSRGDPVTAGTVIGYLAPGNGHCALDCLHWGARIGSREYLDPLRLLAPLRIRLYPPEPW